ncbi:META domain-containing protein [Burkholderia cepacia]|uniref:META domain-containing protein n=1 Tax=Burkholderia cepacia TaxID=292 RepID=UPI000F5A71F5|nr:META domain-containing protein [Burkholderia cepacia]MDN7913855.1 META domain-containing protein [Burkholderia cepacia]RQT51691.1 META domain-containing protein [Burkholderia cepacia]RQZ57767.1 META domain-containing protein [Burkholderia cepacia]
MSHLSAAARARTGLLRPLRAPLCALTLATLLAACAMPTHPDSTAPAPDPYNPAAVQLLDDTSWELTSWLNADGTPRAIPHGDNGEPIKLALSTESGIRRASGFSGCNRYMGTYAIKNGLLSFGPLAGTRMACPNTLGGQLEPAYLDALAHIDKTGVQMREPQQLQIVTASGATLTFTHRSP